MIPVKDVIGRTRVIQARFNLTTKAIPPNTPTILDLSVCTRYLSLILIRVLTSLILIILAIPAFRIQDADKIKIIRSYMNIIDNIS